MPAVINAVWKAPDGTLGLVFCNVSESEQQTAYTIDVAEYGLPAGEGCAVVQHHENGASRVIGRYGGPVLSRTETLPARRALLLEIRAGRAR